MTSSEPGLLVADPAGDDSADTVSGVVSPLFVLSVTVVLLLFFAGRPVLPVALSALPVTVRQDLRRAASRQPLQVSGLLLASRFDISRLRSPRHAGPPASSRAARAAGYRDPLAPHRAIVGPEARTPWYVRIRAIVLLLLIVVAIGVGIAVVTLIVIASGRFVLELLAG